MDVEGTRPGGLLAERFLLRRQLGRGGAATVWQATDLQGGREVAVKLLHPRFRSAGPVLNRLRREAELLARLDHPSIARAVALELDRAQPFFVMELVDGHGLDLDIGARADLDEAYADATIHTVMRQLCEAVDAAHQRGVVHRDLKPSNVMIAHGDGGPRVKVLDFGVAKLLDTAVPETTQGRAIGSLAYMAPEQALGQAVDERTDVFALGVILFELVTLRRVWARDDDGGPLPAYTAPVRPNAYNSVATLGQRIVTEARPVPSRFRPGLVPALDDLLAAALAIEPADRPPSALALLERLPERLSDGRAPVSPTAPRDPSRAVSLTAARPPTVTAARPPSDAATRPPTATIVRADSEPEAAATRVDSRTEIDELAFGPTLVRASGPEAATRLHDGAAPTTVADPRPRAATPGARRAALGMIGVTGGVLLGVMSLALSRSEPPTSTALPEPPSTPGAVPVQPSVLEARPPETPRAPVPARPSPPGPREPGPPPAGPRPSPSPTAGPATSVRPAPEPSPPAAPSPSLALVRRRLEAARAAPDDADRLGALRDALVSGARELQDATARARVERLTTSAAFGGELAGFERAAEALERAAR